MINSVKAMVESPHVIYKRYCQYWNFLLNSYEGGIDYCNASTISDAALGVRVMVNGKEINSGSSGNLFAHAKERSVDYKTRVSMSYYYNFCAPIIDIYTNHLFKQAVMENFEGIQDKAIQSISDDIDKKGSSIFEFRKEVSELAQVYGHVGVVCDVPMVDESIQINTLKDKIDNRAFPYFVTYHPQNIINWALDSFGQPYWVLLREDEDANEDINTFNKDMITKTRYRLLTRSEWAVFDDKYNLISTGIHALARVPITIFYDKQSKKVKSFLGISMLADIAYISRDIYNSCSELRQILRDQTFAFLALQGNADEYKELTIGTSKGLLYPEGRNVPQYVSPPSQNAEVYFSHIDRQVSKIFQLAKLEGGSAHFEGQNAVQQSGVSKAWDFNQTNSALSKKASNMEDGEMKLWQIFALYEGSKFEGSITYPNEFSVKDLNSDLDEAEKLVKLNLGKSFEIEIKKAIINKKFPRLPDEELQKMEEELTTAIENPINGNGNRNGDTMRNRLFPLLKRTPTQAVKGGVNV